MSQSKQAPQLEPKLAEPGDEHIIERIIAEAFGPFVSCIHRMPSNTQTSRRTPTQQIFMSAAAAAIWKYMP